MCGKVLIGKGVHTEVKERWLYMYTERLRFQSQHGPLKTK